MCLSPHPRRESVCSSSSRAGFSFLELLLILLLTPFFLLVGLRRAGEGSAVEITDTQVGVLVDYARGGTRVLDLPGLHARMPYFQELSVLDKSPKSLRMEGNEERSAFLSPRLIARASDGSSYAFEALEVEYAIRPGMAQVVLNDLGTSVERPAHLVQACARSILRDELGRFTCEEIVHPDNLAQAVDRAHERLAGLLTPHGIDLLQISTPKPSFPPSYESAIERRRVGTQETEHLKAKLEQLRGQRAQRLARVRQEKDIELKKLEGELERALITAKKQSLRTRREADMLHERKLASAESERFRFAQEAASMRDRYQKEAQGFARRVAALGESKELAVRAALIEKLSSIELDFVPIVNPSDASPHQED